MAEVSDKTIVLLLIGTVLISLGGTFLTMHNVNKALNLKGLTAPSGLKDLTGFALVPNGTATLTVQTTSSIVFTQATVDFGTGNVNTSGGFNNCTMVTVPGANGGNRGCESFNVVTNGFTIENDGNTNLTVTLYSNYTASQFIGSDGAWFAWNVTLNESGSCINVTGHESVVDPNTTADCDSGIITGSACGAIFEQVVTSPKTICPRLRFQDSNDALNIDINVSVPSDSPTGTKTARLVVTGTRAPIS